MLKGRKKGVRQAAHYAVVHPLPRSVSQFVYRRTVRILRDAIQRCSREVEMNRVEWIVDEKYWIALEIVDRRRAGLQSRSRSRFPVFPIFVNRIVPELERN